MGVLLLLLFFIIPAKVSAIEEGVTNYIKEYFAYKDAFEFLNGCHSKELSLCFKEKTLQYLDNLPDTMDIGGGLTLKLNDGERISRQTYPLLLPEEATGREEALDNLLMEKITDYLRSHSFEFRVPNETIKTFEESVEEGRKKKGGGGGGMRMKQMFMLLQVKAAIIGAILLKTIGLVAFKALLLSKIALTIASIITLKKLLEHKPHSSTYEVHAHPHYDDYSHYDRSFSKELPYRDQDFSRRDQ